MTSRNGRSRARSTSHQDGVPDLTPHINDPLEHIRNIFKGFCQLNLGGDDRSPPIVPREAIVSQKLTPEVCGFLCLDSHSKELEPCLPCKNEEDVVELQAVEDDSSITANGHARGVLIAEDSSVSTELNNDDEWEIIDAMDADDDKPARRIMDSLMASVLVLLVAAHVLRCLGYSNSMDLSIDAKSFAESQLGSSVMGEPFIRNDDDGADVECDNDSVEEELTREPELSHSLNEPLPIDNES